MMDSGSVKTRVQLPAGTTIPECVLDWGLISYIGYQFQVVVEDSAGTSATTGLITLANGGKFE